MIKILAILLLTAPAYADTGQDIMGIMFCDPVTGQPIDLAPQFGPRAPPYSPPAAPPSSLIPPATPPGGNGHTPHIPEPQTPAPVPLPWTNALLLAGIVMLLMRKI